VHDFHVVYDFKALQLCPSSIAALYESAHLHEMSPAFSSLDERNEFVLRHGEFARKIALGFRVVAKVARVDLEDVIQDAWLGLLLASEKWNPEAWPESDHQLFLKLWVTATIKRGLSIHGPSPDCQRLGASGTGLFGSVADLPEGTRYRVRGVRVISNRLVWLVDVKDKPKQRRSIR
jgi:hypothetical protein